MRNTAMQENSEIKEKKTQHFYAIRLAFELQSWPERL